MQNESSGENKLNTNPNNEINFSEVDYDTVTDRLRKHQDLYYAVIGGFLSMLISAIIWAIITVATKHQIGYMAIGVGFLVGLTVRFFGAGIDKIYGIIGALFALFGCLLGNLFSQIGFISIEQSIGIVDVVSLLKLELIPEIIAQSFQPVDLLFYGFALYEGYRFSFRPVTKNLFEKLKNPEFEPFSPKSNLRKPIAVISIISIAVFYIIISRNINGVKTFYYDTGEKLSKGQIQNGNRQGQWISWNKNGSKQSDGFFVDNEPDSIWKWYNENGKVIKIGHYKRGLEHGTWINYFDSGIVSDSVYFLDGRMYGLTKSYYPDGKLFMKGFYNRNEYDSTWEMYYENGKLKSFGNYRDGGVYGIWKLYYDTGKLSEIDRYISNNSIEIIEAWDWTGKHIVRKGNGIYQNYNNYGNLLSQGKIKNGKKIGVWINYYENGKIKEKGHFENNVYFIDSYYKRNGEKLIQNGKGIYSVYADDGKTIILNGKVLNGLRNGTWNVLNPLSQNVIQTLNYVKGKMNGIQETYYDSGELASKGLMENDLKEGEWIWYNDNGTINSKVNFVHNKKDGKQILCDNYGETLKEEYYDKGKLIKELIL